jgi:hypothetical protein
LLTNFNTSSNRTTHCSFTHSLFVLCYEKKRNKFE